MKNFYELLGVPGDAPGAQIRNAYLERMKVLHPDLYCQESHPQAWEQANERIKELNEAYSVLRDPIRRGTYDATLLDPGGPYRSRRRRGTSHNDTEQDRTKRSIERGYKVPESIQAGRTLFGRLNARAQALLRGDPDPDMPEAIRIEFAAENDTVWRTLGLAGLVLAFIYQACASPYRWDPGTWAVLAPAAAGFAFLFWREIEFLLNWRAPEPGSCIVVAPVYVIVTTFEKVDYYPIWDLAEYTIEHKYAHGKYAGTEVKLAFVSGEVRLMLYSRHTARLLKRRLGLFLDRARDNSIRRDLDYFRRYGEALELSKTEAWQYALLSKNSIRSGAVALATTILALAAGYVATTDKPPRPDASEAQAGVLDSVRSNQPDLPVQPDQPDQPAQEPGTIETDPAPGILAKVEDRLERPVNIPFPPHDAIEAGGQGRAIAPLTIRSMAVGVTYYVTVCDYKNPATVVLRAFIRPGQELATRLPVGTYLLKYASGKRWRDEQELFGPDTVRTTAEGPLEFHVEGDQIHGHIIDLSPHQEDRLKTSRLSQGDS